MPIIKYIDATGNETEAEVSVGNSVMQGAVDNMVDGILADCGGACACATCHCYVSDDWVEIVGEAEELEETMLDMVVERKVNSRLSCQIKITEALEGLVVHLPTSQY